MINKTKSMSDLLSSNAKKQIDEWVKKYPEGCQKSAVMAALKIVQVENGGYLTNDLVRAVADYLNITAIEAQEVATFYENYNHQSVGKHQIRFCHNISCMLNGADELIAHLEQRLKIKAGEVNADRRFSLKKVECLGACVGAPMMQIGDDYYEHLTIAKLEKILDTL